MADEKKRNEKKPPIPGVPGGSVASPPELPVIRVGAGAAARASSSGLFAGAAGKIALVSLIGAVGASAFNVGRAMRSSQAGARPASIFAAKPAAGGAAAPGAPLPGPADGIQVVPPADAARYGAAPAPGGGGAAPISADAASAASGQTGTVADGKQTAANAGAGASPAPAPAVLASGAGSLPRAATDFKPSAPTPASGGASSGASYTAAPAAAAPARAFAGSAKAMGATTPSGSRGSAIAGSHGRGALRQLLQASGSSRRGAQSSGEASAAAAGMNFDNGSAITGGGARPMGGAGADQAPRPNTPRYDGGSPINTGSGGMPQAMPTAGHKDVTPWSKLATAATFLLLGASLLLVTAQLLASYAKKHPTGVHSLAMMTAAEWIAGTAGVMGLTAAGIGGKIISMGGGLQGWMTLGGGLLTAGLAAYAVMSDVSDKAQIESEQKFDNEVVADKLKGAKMVPENHLDDVHHMSTDLDHPVKTDIMSHATPQQPTLDQMMNPQPAPPNACAAPPGTAASAAPTTAPPANTSIDLGSQTSLGSGGPSSNYSTQFSDGTAGGYSQQFGPTSGAAPAPNPMETAAAPAPAPSAPAPEPSAPAPAPDVAASAPPAPAAPAPQPMPSPAPGPAPSLAAAPPAETPPTMFNSQPPAPIGSGNVAANQASAFDELGQGEASGLRSYTESTTNVDGHIETQIHTEQ